MPQVIDNLHAQLARAKVRQEGNIRQSKSLDSNTVRSYNKRFTHRTHPHTPNTPRPPTHTPATLSTVPSTLSVSLSGGSDFADTVTTPPLPPTLAATELNHLLALLGFRRHTLHPHTDTHFLRAYFSDFITTSHPITITSWTCRRGAGWAFPGPFRSSLPFWIV